MQYVPCPANYLFYRFPFENDSSGAVRLSGRRRPQMSDPPLHVDKQTNKRILGPLCIISDTGNAARKQRKNGKLQIPSCRIPDASIRRAVVGTPALMLSGVLYRCLSQEFINRSKHNAMKTSITPRLNYRPDSAQHPDHPLPPAPRRVRRPERACRGYEPRQSPPHLDPRCE